MSRIIKFLSLQKQELAYEVAIRGGNSDCKVEELRKQISKLAPLFPSEDILESHLEIKEDIAALNSSLDKLDNIVGQLSVKNDVNFKRAVNLANHIYHRINRIDVSSVVGMLEVLEASLERFQSLSDALDEIYMSENEPTPQISQAQFNFVPNPSPLPPINVHCDRGFSNDFSSLRYNGKSCARAFIRRVDEFITARNISPDKVLLFATEIFTDEALHWFRCIRSETTSWNQVCKRLKDDFSQADYDYRFLSEIRARTQGEKENITIYLSIMSGMFSQLHRQLSEEEKLEIILHNIRPSYATVLTSSPNIKDIESLRILCKNYESVQSRVSQFQEPPRVSSSTMAPDYAYTHSSQAYSKAYSSNYSNFNSNRQNTNFNHNFSKNNYQDKTQSVQNPNSKSNFDGHKPVHTIEKKKQFCPRCRVDTHGLRSCTAERKIVCFRCGRPDVKFYNCPDCQGSPSSSHSKN